MIETRLFFVAEAGLEPTTFGLCVPLQLSLLPAKLPGFGGLDCTFTLDFTLGCPITSLYTCHAECVTRLGITITEGFTEFKG